MAALTETAGIHSEAVPCPAASRRDNLSYVMCRHNSSFLSFIAGGFGKVAPSQATGDLGEHSEISAEEATEVRKSASLVVITPGYGMAVARAQCQVAELTRKLRESGIEVRFGIHPVARRLPGHMNVLLAEAKVPYDIVLEMAEINDELADTDVVLVIGANDTVTPAASEVLAAQSPECFCCGSGKGQTRLFSNAQCFQATPVLRTRCSTARTPRCSLETAGTKWKRSFKDLAGYQFATAKRVP